MEVAGEWITAGHEEVVGSEMAVELVYDRNNIVGNRIKIQSW